MGWKSQSAPKRKKGQSRVTALRAQSDGRKGTVVILSEGAWAGVKRRTSKCPGPGSRILSFFAGAEAREAHRGRNAARLRLGMTHPRAPTDPHKDWDSPGSIASDRRARIGLLVLP